MTNKKEKSQFPFITSTGARLRVTSSNFIHWEINSRIIQRNGISSDQET